MRGLRRALILAGILAIAGYAGAVVWLITQETRLVFEAGRSIWCRGEMGVSILERVEAESSDDCVVVLVTTAVGLEPPYTPAGIKAATTFTMIEDWELAPGPEGTTLTKTWRDIRATGDPPFPLEDAVRETAKGERDSLVERWNEAARAR